MLCCLAVQNYYFAFLFMQLFLVVAIAASYSTIMENITDVISWPELLAQNILRSSNYFFSYMMLQAMSVSAGALVQIMGLFTWVLLAPIKDFTAQEKWARMTSLNGIQWDTFFPVYTTLASIGTSLIFSVNLEFNRVISRTNLQCCRANHHCLQHTNFLSLLVRLSLPYTLCHKIPS